MKIIFIDFNDKQRQIYRIYLENILDEVEVNEFYNSSSAIEFLQKNHVQKGFEYDLVLCNDNFKEGSASEVYEFIHQNCKKIPFVLFAETLPEMIDSLEGFRSHHKQNGNIVLPISPADFRTSILEFLYPNRLNLQPVPAFQKIRLINFYRFNKTLCNVYLKLSRLKYVKVFNEGHVYTKADLKKLKTKNVDYLFIRNDDFHKFQVTFFKNPFLTMDTDNLSPDELRESLSFSHTMMQELVLSLGFSQDVINLTEKSIQGINTLIESCPSLNELLDKAKMNNDYLYDHSYLTSIIACDILKNLNWATEEKIKVMCMASLFHDITLDNPDLAKVTSFDDPELNKYSEDEQKQFLKHPLAAADLLLDFPNIPSEVQSIVRQHHENPEGTGFPNKLNAAKIDRMTCAFIIAHDFVNQMEKVNFEADQVSKITDYLVKRYQTGEFKSCLNAFMKTYDMAS